MDVQFHLHSSMCNVCEWHMIVKCHPSIVQGYSSIHGWKKDIHWFIHDVQTQSKLLSVICTSFYIICPISYISWILFLLGLMDVIQNKVGLHYMVLFYFDLWFWGWTIWREHLVKDDPCTSLVVKHYTLWVCITTLVRQKGWAIFFHLDVQQHFWQGVNLNIQRVFNSKVKTQVCSLIRALP